MNPEFLTKEKVVYFFNKYKLNSNRIYFFERRQLQESCKSHRWEIFLKENSDLTRQLYLKNKLLLDAYFQPAITHPETLMPETIEAFLLHITFFLFENNIDSLVTEELLCSFLKHPEILSEKTKFSAMMNLGIYRTLTGEGSFSETQKIFEEALSIFPDIESAGDNDTRIHLVFCRIYQMLSFCLYSSSDYAEFIRIYNETEKLLRSGTPELYHKMWGKGCDSDFHIEYLMRFCRVYGIFMAGRTGFCCKKDSSAGDLAAADEISGWLEEEFFSEEKEGEINLMIYTFFYKKRFLDNKLSPQEYSEVLCEKFESEKKHHENRADYIFPELAFPDDNDPVEPMFSRMLDKMKLFNKTFSYVYVFLLEFCSAAENKELKNEIIRQFSRYFEVSKYAEKGFKTDKFEIEIIRAGANFFDNINDFMIFFQTILIHRQISTANHVGMVGSIAGICFYSFVERRPELFFIPGEVESAADIENNKFELLKFIKNCALIHDIGKIWNTSLINLHFRRITDREFIKIKSHSSMGAEIIKGIPYLEKYKDFILGHHKFWDDEGGYPEIFKVQASVYKYYVGLLTLADCIDTATDSEGRNYAAKKTFDDILEELKNDAGTRYSPELVELMSQDERLKNQLRILTSSGRERNIKQTYSRFIQQTVEFSEQEERTVSVMNEALFRRVPDFFRQCYPGIPEDMIIKHVEELSDGRNSRIYVMHDRTDRIYGLVGGIIRTSFAENNVIFYMTEIMIHPDFRRKGLGYQLLSATKQFLQCDNVGIIRINTKQGCAEETFLWINGFSRSSGYMMEMTISLPVVNC